MCLGISGEKGLKKRLFRIINFKCNVNKEIGYGFYINIDNFVLEKKIY